MPSESDSPVEVPGFSPAIQPASKPDRSIPAIVWVVLPSVVLGVLLFLWRGKRRSTGRSKPLAQPPTSQKSPVAEPPAEPKKSLEQTSLEGELEETDGSVLTAHPLEPNSVETEQPPELSDAVPPQDFSTAGLEKSFEEQVDEAIAETLEVAPELKPEVEPEVEPDTGLGSPDGVLEMSSDVLPDRAVDGVSLTEEIVAEEIVAEEIVLDEAVVDEAVVDEAVLDETVADEPPQSDQADISTPALPESSPPSPQHFAANWTVARLQEAFLADLLHFQGKTLETATLQECYAALVRLICEEILGSADLSTPETRLAEPEGRIVAELFPCCADPLPIATTINNLGLLPIVESALQQLGLSLSQLSTQQKESALNQRSPGNLLVGYLEALATAEVAAIGYGMCDVKAVEPSIRKGWQVEGSIEGTRSHDPWHQPRPDLQVEVKFGGQTYAYLDEHQHYRVQWIPSEGIVGIPYDVPIAGYQNNTINCLRLWQPTFAGKEVPDSELELSLLSENLPEAMPEHERITWRLKQQYFLVACTVQDLLRLHFKTGGTPETVAQRIAVQLNDPETLLAIAELMRLLLDDYGMAWEQAWEMTQQTFSFTQHSVLLASVNQLYSLELFANLLPRHLEVIYEVNSRFLTEIRNRYPGEIYRLRQMSLIDEQGDRFVRLPYLACLGSHAINGTSQLQMDLLQQKILRDFYQEYPGKFKTIRNGITPRLGLLDINPSLSDLISAKIGDAWITDLGELSKLSVYVEDREFVQYWRQVKQAAKSLLADRIYQQY
ncbi:MAG TPA: glycogen/starch/alpha-glucan phosphorylase, partial [Allocoleopsis sp.]